MKVKVWGARGSIPAPGAGDDALRRQHVVRRVDAVGRQHADPRRGHRDPQPRPGAAPVERPIHILLTHLHLDHIQGLMFFAPLFRPESEITIWGPLRRKRRCATGSRDTSPPRSRRSRSASCPRSVIPRGRVGRVGDRRGAGQRPGGQPPWPDARLPDRGRGRVDLLHPRSRARSRRARCPSSTTTGSPASSSRAAPRC